MTYAILIVAALLVAYVILAARMKLWPWSGEIVGAIRPRGEIDKALARLGIPNPVLLHSAVTAKGARVQSTVQIPQVALDTIDAALDELFVWYRAAYPGWTKVFTHEEYAVLLIEPMATNQDGSPALLIIGQQSAGTCIGFPFPMSYIVLPHQELRAWTFRDYLFNSVFNEGEHYIQSHNNRDVFNSHVGFGDVHRHIGPPGDPEPVGFRSIPRRPSYCGLEKA